MINEKKFREYEKELCKHNGYLPFIIRTLIGKEYIINLFENDNYKNILKKIEETRHYNKKESLQELNDWIKEHPEYKQIIGE